MVLKISDISEFELIERIEKITSQAERVSQGLTLGIGDDTAAFIPEPGYQILVTCDSMVEGRHYLKDYITPFEIGKRTMVMNISDVGAMGGEPLYALVTLGLTSCTPVEDIEEIYRGFISELAPFKACVIGGNITSVNGNPFMDITLIGQVKKKHMILRSGARPRDAVMITGYPGQSAAGYWLISNSKHETMQGSDLLDSYLRPCHRAREGHALAMSGKITSMIDISDGFSGDLFHICEKSRVGIEVKEEMLPVSKAMNEISNNYKININDFILGASDDYELLFTCPPENTNEIHSILSGFNCPVTTVGTIMPLSQGITIITKGGAKKELQKNGWDHFSK